VSAKEFGSAEGANWEVVPDDLVAAPPERSFRAFSAKELQPVSTWADGPGYYISRLWR
jgi:hypothetical protein